MNITEVLVIISTVGWPIIPIAWVPMHAIPSLRKKMGLFYYAIPMLLWPPVALLLYLHLPSLVKYKMHLPYFVHLIGWILLVGGAFLFVYTALFIRPWVLIGLPEVYKKIKASLVTNGPYSLTRNPVYFLHFVMLTGIFLTTGVIAILIIVILDLLTAYLLIIPFEEKELFERFGIDYIEYRNKIPRFWPRVPLFSQISYNR